MGNPLSHVGQSARPEISEEVEQHCVQVQSQQQQEQGSQAQSKDTSTAADHFKSADNAQPATRLPQHPRQDAGDAPYESGHNQPVNQEGETRAEDNVLPSPNQAD